MIAASSAASHGSVMHVVDTIRDAAPSDRISGRQTSPGSEQVARAAQETSMIMNYPVGYREARQSEKTARFMVGELF